MIKLIVLVRRNWPFFLLLTIAALALRLGVEPLPGKNARSQPGAAELPFESRERI